VYSIYTFLFYVAFYRTANSLQVIAYASSLSKPWHLVLHYKTLFNAVLATVAKKKRRACGQHKGRIIIVTISCTL
jgi:hypothetical protein